MSDFFQNLFDFYKERIESPFLFTFLFCWMVINRGFLFLVIFYDGPNKYQNILNHQFEFYYAFCFPFLLSCIYIVAIPFINNALQWLKYSLLNKIQFSVQSAKNDYNSALELHRLKKDLAELEEGRKKLAIDSDELKENVNNLNAKMTILSNQNVGLKRNLESGEKMNNYLAIVAKSLSVRTRQTDISTSPSQTVTNCCSISFYVEGTGRVTPHFWIDEVVDKLGMPFTTFIELYNRGKVGDLFEFESVNKIKEKVSIREIKFVMDTDVQPPSLPYDLKAADKPVM